MLKEKRDAMREKMRKNLPSRKGSNNPMAKLTEEAVEKIRKVYSEGTGIPLISDLFKVSQAQVRRVLKEENWK